MISKAKFVKCILVDDPDSKGDISIGNDLKVEIAIYKHENGGMFGIDASYVDQVLDEDDEKAMCMADPFMSSKNLVILED